MPFFYFFTKDKECRWMRKEIQDFYPRYLHEPIDYFHQFQQERFQELIARITEQADRELLLKNYRRVDVCGFLKAHSEYRYCLNLNILISDENRIKDVLIRNGCLPSKVKFHLILEWVFGKTRGANLEFLAEQEINFVSAVGDLPAGDGIYTTGYDANLEELSECYRQGIPIIEHPCPWVKKLRIQLMEELNPDTHQCVLILDEGHMVYECYKKYFPTDIIVIKPENYEKEILKKRNGKPIHLISYTVFRKKDIARIVEFIQTKFPHPGNLVGGYTKTVCCWARQGGIEEIAEMHEKERLEQIWVICSSEGDRSTMSILREIRENNMKPVIIKKTSDIPAEVHRDSRIGVFLAPIPLSAGKRNILAEIYEKYGTH